MTPHPSVLTLDGVFAPPSVGRSDVPIRITGPGTLSVSPEGLGVRGLKEASNALLTGALYLAVLGAFLLTAVLLSVAGLQAKIAGGLAFAAAAGVGVVGSQYVQRKKREASERAQEQVDWLIPFSSISLVSSEDPCVLIHVKKFKPSGALHFIPADGKARAALQESLSARGIKVRAA